MILGDSLQVMASLAEREGLRGKVQCIYIDPPYGIRFNSNFQWSTTSRDVKDGNAAHITREPEQVKAFRDTWRDGIHSYLTYLRDRLTVARDLLSDSGSLFVQIGDENVHRVRALMDEILGEENFCGLIGYKKTTGAGSPAIGTDVIASVKDYILWFARTKKSVKYRQLYFEKEAGGFGAVAYNRIQSPCGAMHLSKGLEFRAVAVMACDDEILPRQARIEAVTDQGDLEEVYDTERHLLYVACTRARDHLLVTGVSPASEFLEDLGG